MASNNKASNLWEDPLYKEMQNTLYKVYWQRAEESKRYSNPSAYAKDRYYNPNAKHYVGGDLTMVSAQINDLFKRNGISIPENLKLSFAIDSQYRLKVTGTEDEGLIKQIEELLNSKENSEDAYMAVNRERLYGNMRDDEIQDQNQAKHPDKLTNRDLCLIMPEMGEVGAIPKPGGLIGAYSQDYCFDIDGGRGTVRVYECWLNSLDKHVSTEFLVAQYNASKITQFPEERLYAANLKDFLLKCCDVHLTADGFMAVGASRSDLINKLLNR